MKPCQYNADYEANKEVKRIMATKPVVPGPYEQCGVCGNWIQWDAIRDPGKVRCPLFASDTYWY